MEKAVRNPMIHLHDGYQNPPFFEGYESKEFPYACDYSNSKLEAQVSIPLGRSVEEVKKELGIQ